MPIQDSTAYNQSSYGVTYELAPGMTHKLTYSEHAIRQVCHLWGIGSVSLYLTPLGYGMKAAADLAACFIPAIALPTNIPGHQLPCIGGPVNWMWKNPIKASFITLSASIPSLSIHLKSCLGEHLYTARALHYAYANQTDIEGYSQPRKFDALTISAYKIFEHIVDDQKLNITEGSDFTDKILNQIYIPKHLHVHINETFLNECKNRIYNNPMFLNFVRQQAHSGEKLRALIHKHIADEFYQKELPQSPRTEL